MVEYNTIHLKLMYGYRLYSLIYFNVGVEVGENNMFRCI